MVHKDIQKRVRQIEIYTKRLLSGSLVGQNSSAVKGSGFEFDQLREYHAGDDVRFIDWKSSVRSDKVMVRQYIEERSRSIVLAVDVSGSSFFGSREKTKYDLIAEIAAVIGLAGSYAKDQIALLLFSDEIELFIPPASGEKHMHALIEKLFTYSSKKRKTSLHIALEYIAKLRLKNVVLFLISDFIAPSFHKSLKVVAKRYDVIAIRCLDNNEITLPAVGFLSAVDIETGETVVIDARHADTTFNAYCSSRLYEQNKLFSVCNVDVLEVRSTQPYIHDMVRFFKRRMLY